jgi:hypothetical protein
VLSYLDDLIIPPGGIWLATRLIPPKVLAEARATFATGNIDRSVGKVGTVLIILAGVFAAMGAVYFSCAAQREYNQFRRLL